jgi:hypothetical protein
MGHVETSLLMFTGLEINCVLKKAILLIATDLKIIVEANFPNANADNCINYNCIGITISETTVAFLRQEKKGKDISIFHSPLNRAGAEAFQSLFSHTDGNIRDGCGEVGTDPALSVI